MPTKIKRLAAELRASARQRGHKLAKGFYHQHADTIVYHVSCKRCDKCGVALSYPRPNETEISGQIVALGCND